MNKRITIFIGITLGVLALATIVLAQVPGEGRGRGRVAFGIITEISDAVLVIEPRIPDLMAERMAERGRSLPELPAELRFAIDDTTEFYLAGESTDISAFAIGDEVVVAGRRGDSDTPVARKVADPETARQYFEQGMGQRGEQMRERAHERMRPAFGEITALSDSEVTISTEIPDFVQAILDERGITPPGDMPASVTLAISERTKFFVDSAEADGNPFSVGDRVALLAGPGGDGQPAVWAMSDYTSAQAKCEEMKAAGGHGPRGDKGKRDGDHRGKRGRGQRGNAPSE
jgi:hypothetical protein